MHRSSALIASLALLLAAPLAAQSQEGHVYSALWFKAHTGEEAQYNAAYRETLRPIFNHLVEQGSIVSYLDLTKTAGSASATHLVLVEYPSWTAFGEANQMFDEASQAVLGRPFAEVVAEKFVPYREAKGSDIFVAPPAN